jgi:hypothetical protein
MIRGQEFPEGASASVFVVVFTPEYDVLDHSHG